MSFVKVAETSEIPLDKMKHVEVNGKEIMLVNVARALSAGHEVFAASTCD